MAITHSCSCDIVSAGTIWHGAQMKQLQGSRKKKKKKSIKGKKIGTKLFFLSATKE